MSGTISLARLAVTLRIKSVYTAGKHTLCAQPKCREGFFVGPLRGRRDTDAAIDRHPQNFISRKRGEAESSRIHLPSGFARVAPVFYRYASWIHSARRERTTFAEVTADASISKDVRFYCNQLFSLNILWRINKIKVHNVYVHFLILSSIF